MKWFDTFSITFIVFFGHAFAFRTLMMLKHSFFFSNNMLTKIGTVYVSYCMIVIASGVWSRWQILLMLFLPNILLLCLIPLIRKKLETHFKSEFPPFLNQVILKMKMGLSFRAALNDVATSRSHFFHEKIKEIINAVAFLQHADKGNLNSFAREVLDEFRSVDACKYKAIERLLSFRKKLETEENFRHKSGQILLQIRLQTVILSTLYLGLLIFIIARFGLISHLRLIAISFLIFTTGALLTFRMGRKVKWKV